MLLYFEQETVLFGMTWRSSEGEWLSDAVHLHLYFIHFHLTGATLSSGAFIGICSCEFLRIILIADVPVFILQVGAY